MVKFIFWVGLLKTKLTLKKQRLSYCSIDVCANHPEITCSDKIIAKTSKAVANHLRGGEIQRSQHHSNPKDIVVIFISDTSQLNSLYFANGFYQRLKTYEQL
ncbi:TPA: hypothetical protein SMF39_004392 [Serratia marcescens]|nr:hypothetical protein [Serratia marcescens]